MKVKDLIEELQCLPEDFEVIISKDPEGNRYYPLDTVEVGFYDADYSEYPTLDAVELREDQKFNTAVLYP